MVIVTAAAGNLAGCEVTEHIQPDAIGSDLGSDMLELADSGGLRREIGEQTSAMQQFDQRFLFAAMVGAHAGDVSARLIQAGSNSGAERQWG